MSVKVTFMKPAYIGVPPTLVLGPARICETIALDATTSASAEDGEIAVLCSSETDAVIFAQGTTPNAAATVATASTTAGQGLPAASSAAVMMRTGDKIQVKAFA